MPRIHPTRRRLPIANEVLETREESLLDVLDHVLNKGVMATGDLTLGVAGVDLVYVRLSAVLCAADRVLPSRARSERRQGGSRRLVARARR